MVVSFGVSKGTTQARGDDHPMTTGQDTFFQRRPGITLFLLSFTALFLELMLIRWVPAVVERVAYYTNLMLISSFLGLGLGALAASWKRSLFPLFPMLLAAAIGLDLAAATLTLPTGDSELRYGAEVTDRWLGYTALIAIFLSNAALFSTLGQRIGRLFGQLPPLRAYSWDLGGSLLGTVAFGLFSVLAFSPIVGMAVVVGLYLLLASGRTRWIAAFVLIGTLALVWGRTDHDAKWSPYHYLTVHDLGDDSSRAGSPPTDLRQMMDPPAYEVRVNHKFYQFHGTIDDARYTRDSVGRRIATIRRDGYQFPYVFKPQPERVLVVGAGGGGEVEAALLAGATRVRAVDVDPMIVALSRTYNASGVYDDPRVEVVVDDGRAALQAAEGDFDVVVFGWLDSHVLSSSMANIRLDGFVYTVESFRRAYELLDDDGFLSVAFGAGGAPWLVHKLHGMVSAATGKTPMIYLGRGPMEGSVLLGVGRDELPKAPATIGGLFEAVVVDESVEVELATDDWPYLYLSAPSIPSDYAIVIGILLVLSIGGLLVLRGRKGLDASDAFFLFLGLGFLLLQTKSIVDCGLYFGTTWFVSMLVIAGILLMVLAANLTALRIPRPSRWFYVGLFASLAVTLLTPSSLVLGWSFAARLAWTVLVVPLPIFFAGILFSTTFRISADPASSFGANLVGATLGGFVEYLGMLLGYRNLSLIIIVAYAVSLLALGRVLRRRGT